jgi:hypothetical protein
MSDYRTPNDPLFDPNDPLRNPNAPAPPELGYGRSGRAMNGTWGWVAAAVFLVVVLAVAFGMEHHTGPLGTNTASNVATPPAATHMAAPTVTPAPPAATPTPPAVAPSPIAPAPNSPAPGNP